MKRKTVLVLIFSAIVMAAVGGFAVFRTMSAASDGGVDAKMKALFAEPRPVLLEEVRSGNELKSRTYPASVQASKEAPLSFRVSGPLVTVNGQPGDFIKKNAVLMAIDPRDFQDSIRVLEAQLSGAMAALEKSRLDFERSKSLLGENVISRASYDAAKGAFETSAASVKDIQARLKIARHQLADTKLLAPFDGIVATKRVENHEMVSAGQVVLTVLDISSLEIKANIPENEIARTSLAPGQEATVGFASLPERTFKAFLKEWSAAPDPSTRTYSVTFALPAPKEAQILPGMTGEISWGKQADAADAVSVPVGALVADGEKGSAVWIFDPDTSSPVKRSVRTGAFSHGGNRVLVLDGLRSGEQIVVAGASFVVEGMKLRPMSR